MGRPVGETRSAELTAALWGVGTVTVLAVLTLGITLIFAVDVGRQLARRDACHLGLEFEVESVETLRTAWFPPSATCEYRLLGRTETSKESRWIVYFPAVPAIALAASLMTLFRLRRHAPSRPPPR